MKYKVSRRRFVASVGSGTLVGLAGCSNRQENSSPTETRTPPPETDTPDRDTPTATPESTPESTSTPSNEAEGAGSEGLEVLMITDNKGSYFDPKGLLIEPGTTVRFVNDSGSHSATAYHPDNDGMPLRIPEGAAVWDSGLYTEVGETFEHTFETKGVYDYYCTPHESLGMVGRIIVGAPQDGPGTKSPDGLPPAARDVLPPIESIQEQEVIEGP